MMSIFPTQSSCTYFLNGPVGRLEVMTTWPSALLTQEVSDVAIICHPHPLHGGNMHHKVITTLAQTFHALKMATVRFNFRGVGASDGEYGQQHGEIEDLIAVYQWVQQVLPDAQLTLVGFSFGSYIAAATAHRYRVKQLVSVAPPVHYTGFEGCTQIGCPWLIIHGERDEMIVCDAVQRFSESSPSPSTLIILPNADHFFHRQLTALKNCLLQALLSGCCS